MKSTSLPPAGEILGNSQDKPQRRDTLLGGFWKKLTGSETPAKTAEVALANPSRSTGLHSRTYSRPLVDELLGRIRNQNAHIAFLNRIMRSTSDAVIVAEPNGRITMFNKGAEDLFQLEEDVAQTDNLFRLCADSSVDGARISKMLMENQRILNMRTEILGANGKKTVALLTIDFVPDPESNEPAAIVAILKDNSALEDSHAKLQEAYVKVEKLSLTDAMTGLFNRRFFDQKVQDEHERMERGHMEAVSLLFIDVDHFKRFNDSYGHQVGDEVLKVVAEAIKDSVRKIDIACRYGGEEMAVILPATSEAGAWRLAERIRTRVESLQLPVGGKAVAKVTCSIGIQTHRPKDGDVGNLIHEADQAVYQAKQTGRNKSVAYQKAA
jgi:diguanylate cyclase (GGDEF)-like protein/PAS domain S-box-containing protein